MSENLSETTNQIKMKQLEPDTPGMSEIQIQSKAYQYLYNNYKQIRGLLFHVPNGGHRGKIEATQLQASGVVPGIPDLILIWGFAVLYGIEVKKPGGYTSKDQDEVHATWKGRGVKIVICFTSHEIVNFVLNIIQA